MKVNKIIYYTATVSNIKPFMVITYKDNLDETIYFESNNELRDKCIEFTSQSNDYCVSANIVEGVIITFGSKQNVINKSNSEPIPNQPHEHTRH